MARTRPGSQSVTLVAAALMVGLWGCGGASTTALKPVAVSPAPGGIPGYRELAAVSLPGPTYRWDYQAFDPASARLYLADLGQNQVVVFDTRTQSVEAIVPGVASVHGIALAPDLNLALATAAPDNSVVAIDTRTLSVVGTVPVGLAPNGIAYAPSAQRFFVTDGAGLGDTVVATSPLRATGRVTLGTGIGNTIFDPSSGLIFVSLGNQQELVAVDPKSQSVTRRYRLPGCNWPHGIAVDRGRAFIACAFNSKLKVLDLATGRVTQTLDTGTGPDVVALDAALHRLYVASDSGRLGVFDVGSARVRRLSLAFVGSDAHSVGVDTTSHYVFLPLPSASGPSRLLRFVPD